MTKKVKKMRFSKSPSFPDKFGPQNRPFLGFLMIFSNMGSLSIFPNTRGAKRAQKTPFLTQNSWFLTKMSHFHSKPLKSSIIQVSLHIITLVCFQTYQESRGIKKRASNSAPLTFWGGVRAQKWPKIAVFEGFFEFLSKIDEIWNLPCFPDKFWPQKWQKTGFFRVFERLFNTPSFSIFPNTRGVKMSCFEWEKSIFDAPKLLGNEGDFWLKKCDFSQ